MLLEVHRYVTERGWSVFPVHGIKDGVCTCMNVNCKDAGKHPVTTGGVKDATRDAQKVADWFSDGRFNVGVATGEISNITLIDIDIGEGKFGDETWAKIIEDNSEPLTLTSNTGSGGLHMLFTYNSALKTSTNTFGKGIDVRNDGGYFVAPPSIHRSGGSYTWVDEKVKMENLPAFLSRKKETRGRPKRGDVYRSKYTIDQIEKMLSYVPSEDRDIWRVIGIILGREFNRSDQAWAVYVAWSEKAGGKKGRHHDSIMNEAFYNLSTQSSGRSATVGTIVKSALDHGWTPEGGSIKQDNFIYFAPGNNYIYRPTFAFWISSAVDAVVPMENVDGRLLKASDWLRGNRVATSMTCDPELESDFISGSDCRNGELHPSQGAVFNSYRKANIQLGDAKDVEPLLIHLKAVFPHSGDVKQFLDYMAHRVQLPWQKPRFALLLAGGQGVGKDTAVEMCCPAVGSWNVSNIDPADLESNFNEYCASTLVRISEAANLHEMTKWAFNERTKVLIAGSPDVVTINPKYGQKYSVKMHCGVIVTTNHLSTGIFIPEDDRRYDVIDSATLSEMGLTDENERKKWFNNLWNWYYSGGMNNIAAFLTERDISEFDPNGGQRKTQAHQNVVALGMASDDWLVDILEDMGDPRVVRLDTILAKAVERGENAIRMRAKVSNAMARLGYFLWRNPAAKDGRWKLNGKSRSIWIKPPLPDGINILEIVSKDVF